MITNKQQLINSILPSFPMIMNFLATGGNSWATSWQAAYNNRLFIDSIATNGMSGSVANSSTTTFPYKIPDTGKENLLIQASTRALNGTLPTSAAELDTRYLLLCDRLWHNLNVNAAITTTQTINSVTFPERDRFNTNSGENVYLALETATGGLTMTANTVVTCNYTNSQNVSNRTASTILISSTVARRFFTFDLDIGDTGIKSIESITFGSGISVGSNVNLVAFKIISNIPTTLGSGGLVTSKLNLDWLKLGLPYIHPDACLFTITRSNNAGTIFVDLTMSQG